MYTAINSLYENYSCSVRVNGKFTEPFYISNGLKQGCIISPTLFKIYINDLVEDINSLGKGITTPDGQVSLLMFADDIVLMAADEADLQVMLDRIENWCNKWRLNINDSKTQIIHYRQKSKSRSQFNFTCGDYSLEYSDKYKYLGVWVHEHLDMSVTVGEVVKSATRALGKVISVFKGCGGTSHEVFTKLFNAAVLPVITYSAGIWGLRDFPKLNGILHKAGRFFLGLPPKSPNMAVQGEMGWNSTNYHTKLQVIRLYCRIRGMDDDRLTKRIFNWSEGLTGNNWVNSVNKFLLRNTLTDVKNMNSKDAVKLCSPALDSAEKEKWSTNIWNDRGQVNGNKLRTYRTFKKCLAPEKYLNLNIPKPQRTPFVKLRCGVLPLEIETGRYYKVELENRKCKLCNLDEVENEIHFLTKCPLYDDFRSDMFTKALNINPAFSQMGSSDKMNFLLSCDTLVPSTIKTVDKMFARRKLFVKR